MATLSFKIPEKERVFLEWWSKKTGESSGSIYRGVTMNNFMDWKLDVLFSEYTKGSIGFKRLSTLSGLSFNEIGLLIQEKNIEPPISELIDEQIDQIRDKFKTSYNFKKKKNFKRKSPEYLFFEKNSK